MLSTELAAVLTISLAAAGAGSLLTWLLLVVGSLVVRIRRLYHPRWHALETFFDRDQDRMDEKWAAAPGRLITLLHLSPALIGAAMSLAVRDVLLSPYLVVLGIGLTWLLRQRRRRHEQTAITNQVKTLVVLFRSRFAVGESPFSVLSEIEADLPKGAVAAAVHQTVNTYQAGGRVEKAMAPLRGLHNPYLARLVMVLEASSSASTEVVVDEVARIEADLKARDRLAGQARASLALLKGTVRFLQAANLTALVVSVSLPMWRDFFTSTLERRGTFLAATLFLVIASLYFDQEVAIQEERSV